MTYTTLQDIPYDDKKDWLKITDLENMFHIYQDDKQNNCYNLNATLYVNVPLEYFQLYTCDCDSTWTLLSYKLYGTTRLAWLLMKLNEVKASEVFQLKHPGDVIKYIPKEIVQNIVGDMNNVNT